MRVLYNLYSNAEYYGDGSGNIWFRIRQVGQRVQIDLVISDLRMDEMDGMALFTKIQKYQPGMPVIILTAHSLIPDAVAATHNRGAQPTDQTSGS